MRASVPVVGVVGGIASGKSFITEQLKRQGAVVISADQLAHEVLRFPEIKSAVREHWGDRVFSGDGEVASDGDSSRAGCAALDRVRLEQAL
jgi:dephospho-CoA kinase